MVAISALFVFCNGQIRTKRELLYWDEENVGVKDEILTSQFILLIAAFVAISNTTDPKLPIVLLMLSNLVGAYGLADRFFNGPRMMGFPRYGLGQFLFVLPWMATVIIYGLVMRTVDWGTKKD